MSCKPPVCCHVGTRVTGGLNWPMKVQNVIWSRAACNECDMSSSCLHAKSLTHGKITNSRMFFELSLIRNTVRSPWKLNRKWKLLGCMNMVFLWWFFALLCNTRAICGTRSSRDTRLPSFYAEKQHREQLQTKNSPKPAMNCAQITHKTQPQPHVELSKVHFHIHNFILACW